MNVKHAFLKIIVWNMKWMTHYLGFIARPFIKWYVDREVMACGLRSEGGDVRIIYSPILDRLGHSFFNKEKIGWTTVDTFPADNFSGDLAQVILPEAKIGEVYIIRTQKRNKNRTIHSPKITIKEQTRSLSDLIEIRSLSGGKACISWVKGKQFSPMLYFLVIENDRGEALSVIYTRESFWEYPLVKKASLSIGNAEPIPLQKNKQYTATLTIIDFDGWVSCIAKKVFIY